MLTGLLTTIWGAATVGVGVTVGVSVVVGVGVMVGALAVAVAIAASATMVAKTSKVGDGVKVGMGVRVGGGAALTRVQPVKIKVKMIGTNSRVVHESCFRVVIVLALLLNLLWLRLCKCFSGFILA